MSTRWLGTLAAAAIAALIPARTFASPDAPHDSSFDTGNCSECHTLYTVGTATGARDYTQGCLTCHNKTQHQGGPNGFPWTTEDQAGPSGAARTTWGVDSTRSNPNAGSQHSWSGPAVNPAYGARSPSNLAMADQLVDGNLQCVVCHDPHNAGKDYAPDSRQTSIPVGAPQGYDGGSASTGTMTLVTPGVKARGTRVQIQTWNGTSGTFILSSNFGAGTPTWLNYVNGVWAVGTAAGEGYPFTISACTPVETCNAVPLDDPAVTVKFGGSPVVGNYWDFYVAYPFLRSTNVDDVMCTQCHAERNQSLEQGAGRAAGGTPNGTRKYSHPVGVTMNQNGKGYDALTQDDIRDTSGVLQAGAGDLNKSNDLVLRGGKVFCTSCHAVHNADSNSLTPDAR